VRLAALVGNWSTRVEERERMTKQEIVATIVEDLKRELLEAQGLERCENDHDFATLLFTFANDLAGLAARYNEALQEFLASQESQA
jgi:hypothetical protein